MCDMFLVVVLSTAEIEHRTFNQFLHQKAPTAGRLHTMLQIYNSTIIYNKVTAELHPTIYVPHKLSKLGCPRFIEFWFRISYHYSQRVLVLTCAQFCLYLPWCQFPCLLPSAFIFILTVFPSPLV